MNQWRKFAFFDCFEVRDDAANAPLTISSKFDLSVCTSGHGALVFGDQDGSIHFLGRDFKPASFKAYDCAVLKLHQMTSQNVLVSVGEDVVNQNLRVIQVKLWSLDKQDKDGSPLLVRQQKVFAKSPTEPEVTALSVSEDLTQLAVGLSNGTLMFFRGDLMRDRYKQKNLTINTGVPVTGLHFRGTGKNCSLFVTTTSSVHSVATGSKTDNVITLCPDEGCEPNCCTMSSDHELVVARSGALFMYMTEEPGGCYWVDSTKRFVCGFRGYIVLVETDPSSLMCQLAVYDTRNKYSAFAAKLSDVKCVLCEFGCIFVVTADNKLWQLKEKDTQTKLETLFKKNLYMIAINLATTQHFDHNIVMDIYRRYGDHLYSKGDYDTAVEQYVKTIEHLEPSYIIRKFLDAQRTVNLTQYLEALHAKKLATSDHTTLLLNCYTKLKDKNMLEKFVNDTSLYFDSHTAIAVLRQAGYHDHALSLAKRHKQHSLAVSILLEDKDDAPEAVDYVWTLAPSDALDQLNKHGRVLVCGSPDYTTALLMHLCTIPVEAWSQFPAPSLLSLVPSSPLPMLQQLFKSSKATTVVQATPQHTSTGSLLNNLNREAMENRLVSAFSHLMSAVTRDQQTTETTATSTPTTAPSATLLTENESTVAYGESAVPRTSSKKKTAPNRPKSHQFIHMFVGKPTWLMVFLETIIAQDPDNCGELAYNTLLELYLRDDTASTQTPDATTTATTTTPTATTTITPTTTHPSVLQAHSRAQNLEKAMQLLKNPKSKYSDDQALLLCQMHKFHDGTLYLYGKQGLHHEILNVHMRAQNHQKVIETCVDLKQPHLWKQVLQYFATEVEGDCAEYIQEVLSHIDKDNLLPPLAVVEILSRNPHVQLSVVKDYIMRRLEEEHRQIKEDEANIKSYQEDSKRMRDEIRELKTSAKIFQNQKCADCTNPLKLPSCHFLCGHSFHQRCLTDERECHVCTAQNAQVMKKKADMERNAQDYQAFRSRLDTSADGFSVIAECFGHGVFGNVARE